MFNKNEFKFGDMLFILACTIPGLYFGLFDFTWKGFAILISIFTGLIAGALISILYKD